MICPKCGTEMIISEWDGWVWRCYHCDYIGIEATNDEVEAQRKEINEYLKPDNGKEE